MITLSTRQKNILQFIVSFFNENKFPPTIREIGEKVGISSTSVVNYNLAKLEEERLLQRRREKSRGLSLNWERLLELGLVNEGQVRSAETSNGGSSTPNGRPTARNWIQVPILGRIAAGEPIPYLDAREAQAADEWIDVAAGLLGSNERLFALRVRGNSMIDASVLDGDLVILHQQESADDGDMVAAWIEGDEETTLKYLYREGNLVRLQPANPAFEPIRRPADKVRINGKVVSVIRVLKN